MADATKVDGTELQASLLGVDLLMVQIALTAATSVLDTGFRSVANVQATWASNVGSDKTLIATVSGSKVTITTTSDLSGQKVWILAMGYRG